MFVQGRKVLLASALIGLLAASPAAADVKTGVDLWEARNYTGAVKEWRPLADKGDADAQFNMGQAYKLGRGAPQDLKIAQTWFEKAAQQGHQQAQANLGLILFQSGNRSGAMPWIRKAADNGDPRAQYVLGTAYFNGDLAPKDLPRAYALMTSAASKGLPQAASSLAQMEKLVPAPDKQKGVALARQIKAGAAKASAAATAPVAKAPRTPAGQTARVAAAKVQTPAAKPIVSAAAVGGWRVQLGAYGSPAAAQGQWSAISRKVGALSALQPSYEKAGAFTRLRAGPLASRAAAEKACASAKAAGQACFPVAP